MIDPEEIRSRSELGILQQFCKRSRTKALQEAPLKLQLPITNTDGFTARVTAAASSGPLQAPSHHAWRPWTPTDGAQRLIFSWKTRKCHGQGPWVSRVVQGGRLRLYRPLFAAYLVSKLFKDLKKQLRWILVWTTVLRKCLHGWWGDWDIRWRWRRKRMGRRRREGEEETGGEVG